jgi:hypothetical protein
MCPFCSANFSRYYDAEYLVFTHGELRRFPGFIQYASLTSIALSPFPF